MFPANFGGKHNVSKQWRSRNKDAKQMRERVLRALEQAGAGSGLSYQAPEGVRDARIVDSVLHGQSKNAQFKRNCMQMENTNAHITAALRNVGVDPLDFDPQLVDLLPPIFEDGERGDGPVIDQFDGRGGEVASPMATEFIRDLLSRSLEDQVRYLTNLQTGAQVAVNNIYQCEGCNKVCKSRGGLRNHRNVCAVD